jgi:5-methylcytosine-specific restriction endonuclease McrA
VTNPFSHEPRRRFTTLERAKFYARANGHCEKCTRKIPHTDDWAIDHIIALSRGGTNEDHNLQILCSWCHDDKTHGDEGDTAMAAKSKRVYAKHIVPKKYQRSRSWGRK